MPRTNSNGIKQRQPTGRENSASAKREAERVHYQKRLRDNEARLSTGLTARDEPMTPEQTETLQRVIEMQRLKLAELTTDGK